MESSCDDGGDEDCEENDWGYPQSIASGSINTSINSSAFAGKKMWFYKLC
jgi:hypothetical protein